MQVVLPYILLQQGAGQWHIALSRVYEPTREYHDFIYTRLNEVVAAPAMEFRGDYP